MILPYQRLIGWIMCLLDNSVLHFTTFQFGLDKSRHATQLATFTKRNSIFPDGTQIFRNTTEKSRTLLYQGLLRYFFLALHAKNATRCNALQGKN